MNKTDIVIYERDSVDITYSLDEEKSVITEFQLDDKILWLLRMFPGQKAIIKKEYTGIEGKVVTVSLNTDDTRLLRPDKYVYDLVLKRERKQQTTVIKSGTFTVSDKRVNAKAHADITLDTLAQYKLLISEVKGYADETKEKAEEAGAYLDETAELKRDVELIIASASDDIATQVQSVKDAKTTVVAASKNLDERVDNAISKITEQEATSVSKLIETEKVAAMNANAINKAARRVAWAEYQVRQMTEDVRNFKTDVHEQTELARGYAEQARSIENEIEKSTEELRKAAAEVEPRLEQLGRIADELEEAAESTKQSVAEALKAVDDSKQNAEEAVSSANTAKEYALEAKNKADIATTQATNASNSEKNASTSAGDARASAVSAATSATNANASAVTAQEQADIAVSKAGKAGVYASNANESANAASRDASSANASANNAAQSAQQAEQSAVSSKTYSDSALEAAESLQGVVEQVEANTADIGTLNTDVADLKESSTELKRSNKALWELNRGITYDFETDSTEAYSKQIPSGAKAFDLKSVGGKSVVVNQLGKFTLGSTSVNGIDVTVNTEKTQITLNGTASAQTFRTGLTIPITKDHKYYICGCPKGGSATTYMCYIVGGGVVSSSSSCYDIGNGAIQIGLADGDVNFVLFRVEANVTVNNLVFKPQCIDLTKMFGAGNEPTLEQCQQIFSAEYYPYNEGEIVSSDVQNVKVSGANIWNEQWELGSYRWSTGSKVNATDTIRAKDYCEIVGGTTYYVVTSSEIVVMFYDSNKTHLGIDTNLNPKSSMAFVAPANAKYFVIYWTNAYGVNYKNDVAIIKGNSGIYSPYVPPINIPLPADYDLKSAGSAHDSVEFYEQDGKYYAKKTQRVGSVDMGTIDWNYEGYFYKGILNAKVGGQSINKVYGIGITPWSANDKCSFINSSNRNFVVFDSTYTDASAFKSAMSGVYLYYELAEPIETITEIDNRFSAILCEGNGSITFEGNADYRLPIPNEEEYLIAGGSKQIANSIIVVSPTTPTNGAKFWIKTY